MALSKFTEMKVTLKVNSGGEGVKNPKDLADVICERPLRAGEIRCRRRAAGCQKACLSFLPLSGCSLSEVLVGMKMAQKGLERAFTVLLYQIQGFTLLGRS